MPLSLSLPHEEHVPAVTGVKLYTLSHGEALCRSSSNLIDKFREPFKYDTTAYAVAAACAASRAWSSDFEKSTLTIGRRICDATVYQKLLREAHAGGRQGKALDQYVGRRPACLG